MIRKDLPVGAKPMEFLKDGMALPESAPSTTAEGVEKINYIDSGAASDVELCERLIDDAGVALVPGTAFGAPGHVRLSFAASMSTLEAALARLQRFFAR